MKRVDNQENRQKITRLLSDSISIRLEEGLLNDLNTWNIVDFNLLQFTCSLHNFNFVLANLVTNLIGLRKLKVKTPIQLLFTFHYL